MITSPSEMGCSSIAATNQATSARNASATQASSHHMRLVYHRYHSLNKVDSIATLWKDTETAADSGVHSKCHPSKGRKVTNQCPIPVWKHRVGYVSVANDLQFCRGHLLADIHIQGGALPRGHPVCNIGVRVETGTVQAVRYTKCSLFTVGKSTGIRASA